jgi:hypothetical protein
LNAPNRKDNRQLQEWEHADLEEAVQQKPGRKGPHSERCSIAKAGDRLPFEGIYGAIG